MKPLLESSVFYRISKPLVDAFGRTYNESLSHKSGKIIKCWVSNSLVYKVIQNYLRRQSHAKASLTYRFLSFIGNILDRAVDKIHSFFINQSRTSKLVLTMKQIATDCKNNLNSVAMALILPIIGGYALLTTIKTDWSSMKIIFLMFFILLLVASFASLDKWKSWVKNSGIYKICHHIWE